MDKIEAKTSKLLSALIIFILVVAIGGILWLVHDHNTKKTVVSTSPVPAVLKSAVNFPIYYPDPKKLPAGYTLNSSSFSTPVKNGVTYLVSYGNSQKLVFSLQPKPSDNELDSFKANYIPLNIPYQTSLGTALIGAYNNHGNIQTMVSLPTNSSTWIIITGPYNTDQTKLKQVLNSLHK